mgnify:CR=1 FL=1
MNHVSPPATPFEPAVVDVTPPEPIEMYAVAFGVSRRFDDENAPPPPPPAPLLAPVIPFRPEPPAPIQITVAAIVGSRSTGTVHVVPDVMRIVLIAIDALRHRRSRVIKINDDRVVNPSNRADCIVCIDQKAAIWRNVTEAFNHDDVLHDVRRFIDDGCSHRTPSLLVHQAIRMIAFDASGVGKITVKSPADAVLSEPKSRITTDGFV